MKIDRNEIKFGLLLVIMRCWLSCSCSILGKWNLTSLWLTKKLKHTIQLHTSFMNHLIDKSARIELQLWGISRWENIYTHHIKLCFRKTTWFPNKHEKYSSTVNITVPSSALFKSFLRIARVGLFGTLWWISESKLGWCNSRWIRWYVWNFKTNAVCYTPMNTFKWSSKRYRIHNVYIDLSCCFELDHQSCQHLLYRLKIHLKPVNHHYLGRSVSLNI